jgi:DNA-binding transcriptional ArsR family regulator
MNEPTLDTLFQALADPTRRAILTRLAEGPAPVKEIAEPFAMSGPAITKHLKVLEQAGLISRSRDGQLRPCQLQPKALAPAADWLEQYRAMWEDQLDRLGEYLATVVSPRTSEAIRPDDVRTPADVPGPVLVEGTAASEPAHPAPLRSGAVAEPSHRPASTPNGIDD